jgi:hypothetical protein
VPVEALWCDRRGGQTYLWSDRTSAFEPLLGARLAATMAVPPGGPRSPTR